MRKKKLGLYGSGKVREGNASKNKILFYLYHPSVSFKTKYQDTFYWFYLGYKIIFKLFSLKARYFVHNLKIEDLVKIERFVGQ